MPSASHKHVCGGSGVMHGKPIGIHNLVFRNLQQGRMRLLSTKKSFAQPPPEYKSPLLAGRELWIAYPSTSTARRPDHNMLPSEPKAFDAGQPDHSGQALYEWLWQSPSPTLELAQSRCFKSPASFLTLEERTRLTYERAKKICDVYGMVLIPLHHTENQLS